jgi:ketosteroid isomerase-like protein
MGGLHEEVVRDLIAALNRGDISRLERWADPELVYDFTRSIGIEAGAYRGLPAIQELFDNFLDAWDEFAWKATRIEELDEDRALISTKMNVRGRGSGLEVAARGAQLLEFRDGKLVRVTMFQGRDQARAELGL